MTIETYQIAGVLITQIEEAKETAAAFATFKAERLEKIEKGATGHNTLWVKWNGSEEMIIIPNVHVQEFLRFCEEFFVVKSQVLEKHFESL